MELKLKRYESKVVKVLSNGDAVIELPDELCIELGWNVGDTLKFSTEGDSIIVTNLSKDQKGNS